VYFDGHCSLSALAIYEYIKNVIQHLFINILRDVIVWIFLVTVYKRME